MYLAFRSENTGQYIEHFRMAATYIHRLDYTDDLQKASLYRKDYFYNPDYSEGEESYMVSRLRVWKERTGEEIVPIEVTLMEATK